MASGSHCSLPPSGPQFLHASRGAVEGVHSRPRCESHPPHTNWVWVREYDDVPVLQLCSGSAGHTAGALLTQAGVVTTAL